MFNLVLLWWRCCGSKLHSPSGRTGHRLRAVGLWKHPSVSPTQAAPTAAAATAARPVIRRAMEETPGLPGPVLGRRGPSVGSRHSATTIFRPGSGPGVVGLRLSLRRQSQYVPKLRLPVRQHRQLRSELWQRCGHAHWESYRSGALFNRRLRSHGANCRLPLSRLRWHGCQDERSECTTYRRLVQHHVDGIILWSKIFTFQVTIRRM